ncbi:MAG: methionine--tRNA ligase [Candidatus Eremiobacteraeota bacterium]|nr:methionine--tRNA ligase [Candidatus Eremiobacteraeota bacterium]
MKEKVLVCTAWPYANGPIHLGHIAGCYLPADIFARYNRTKGNEVLMVSGSDQHGTPITVKAEKEGVHPAKIAERYHKQFLKSWEQLGISYDHFTRTGTDNHRKVVHDVFLKLLEKDYIFKDSMRSPFCQKCQRFLPDRYVEGTCPFCESPNARGDQCDDCGKPLNAEDLVNSQCKICGATPEIHETEHYFLRLTAFNDKLLEWIKTKKYFKPNVYHFTKQYLKDGLKNRAITRDISWGVDIPIEGCETKRIYVWFEAVIGYLSASKEWAENSGDPEKWREYWQDKNVKTYYFIGKDNIPFHTIIWPAMLMAYEGLSLPYEVPSNEFLTLEGKQFSTSRNWALWLSDYLERYDPDPLRYLLSINMPETNDADFSWYEFYRRNNNELVAAYGNLVHRTLTFTFKKFDKVVPEPGELEDKDREILDLAKKTLADMDESLKLCKFKEAIRSAMSLAHESNKYLEVTSPWKEIKENPKRAATSLYVAINLINALKTALYPFLPFSSIKLHGLLGYEDEIESHGWKFEEIPAGQNLRKPKPLFKKLEEEIIEEEMERIKEQSISKE